MSDTKQTTGECGRCKGAVYHDGLNWRHVENDRPLRECPLQTPDFRDLVLNEGKTDMSAQDAQNEQTDAMTLWVAERTLRQYGKELLANELVDFANEIALGHAQRQNTWPLVTHPQS